MLEYDLDTFLRRAEPGSSFNLYISGLTDDYIEKLLARCRNTPGPGITITQRDDRWVMTFETQRNNTVFEGEPDARLDPDPAAVVSRFRPRYRKLSDAELALVDQIKSKATELEALYDRIAHAGRYKALAITALEESVMWAVKDATK